jgi:hypothetical protein
MERLKKKDADAGVESRPVTDDQKAAIAEARSFYGAKMAEAEVLHQSKMQHGRPRRARQTLELQYRGIASGSRPTATRRSKNPQLVESLPVRA